MRKLLIFSLILLVCIISAIILHIDSKYPDKMIIMKDVGEPYMKHFGLTDNDFRILQANNIKLIEGNFDICANDSDVSYFLNQSAKYNLKVIMPAGSGEAEWGYKCGEESYPNIQKPVWDKKSVTEWIQKWKNHTAVYAWDSSNEAGSVFPDSSGEKMLTLDQLRTAYKDIKSIDPGRPVMIRMNGWFFYDFNENFFRQGNPFGEKVSDIVMVNTYSNIGDYKPDFVTIVAERAIVSIHKIDPKVKVLIALGAWKEDPLWKKPSINQFQNDITQVKKLKKVEGIAYFKYGAKGSEWYLPDKNEGASELLEIINRNTL